jgi:hypothetical protein
MAYLALLIPVVALAGVLLIERLESWALDAPDTRGASGADRVTATIPDR